MLPTAIDSSLVIAASMVLLPCGHPEALREVQHQMRLINQAYPDPEVLRCTDEVVRCAARLHGPPSLEPEDALRRHVQAAIERLRARLQDLPPPRPLAARKGVRTLFQDHPQDEKGS